MDKHYYQIRNYINVTNQWTCDEITYIGQPLDVVTQVDSHDFMVIVYDSFYAAFAKGIKLIGDYLLKIEGGCDA